MTTMAVAASVSAQLVMGRETLVTGEVGRGQHPSCSHDSKPAYRRPGRLSCNEKTVRSQFFGGLLQNVTILKGKGSCSRKTSAVAASKGSGDDYYMHHRSEYVRADVMEAVRMVPARGQLFMLMANGLEVEVTHVNPHAGRLLYQSSTPTIFLRVLEDTSLMLPIVVGDQAVSMVMKGLRQEAGTRPNQYELISSILDVVKHQIRRVDITERVVDTYYSRIYFSASFGDRSTLLSVDARPSDAINVAVRAKVPIYVNRDIMGADAIKMLSDPAAGGGRSALFSRYPVGVAVDGPLDGHDPLAEEITLVRSMMMAATEERYADAARMRDELQKLRRSQGRQVR